jgi:hypothetical protein
MFPNLDHAFVQANTLLQGHTTQMTPLFRTLVIGDHPFLGLSGHVSVRT